MPKEIVQIPENDICVVDRGFCDWIKTMENLGLNVVLSTSLKDY